MVDRFFRPSSVVILKRNATVRGRLQSVLLDNAGISLPDRTRLDLTRGVQASSRQTAVRSPVETTVVDNLRKEREVIIISGSLSANPLGVLQSIAGTFGSIIRRDLRELEKLRMFHAAREPVMVVTPQRVYPSMSLSLDEVHDGRHKIEVTLTCEEVLIVSPLNVTGRLDLPETLIGSQTDEYLGTQSGEVVTAPADVGGGLG